MRARILGHLVQGKIPITNLALAIKNYMESQNPTTFNQAEFVRWSICNNIKGEINNLEAAKYLTDLGLESPGIIETLAKGFMQQTTQGESL